MARTAADYPLSEKRRESLFTPSGINIQDVTFENVEAGIVDRNDCRVSRETLLMQAEIARSIGNPHVAENFMRAAEMTMIDSDRLIEIYNMLRPYRATEEELMEVSRELKDKDAMLLSAFVEEACEVLKERKKLKGDR